MVQLSSCQRGGPPTCGPGLHVVAQDCDQGPKPQTRSQVSLHLRARLRWTFARQQQTVTATRRKQRNAFKHDGLPDALLGLPARSSSIEASLAHSASPACPPALKSPRLKTFQRYSIGNILRTPAPGVGLAAQSSGSGSPTDWRRRSGDCLLSLSPAKRDGHAIRASGFVSQGDVELH